jgi:hypothetical protein
MRGRGVFEVTPERPVERTEDCQAVCCLLRNPLYRIFSFLLLYYYVVYVLIFRQPGFQSLSVISSRYTE